jgi:hypothetical protein
VGGAFETIIGRTLDQVGPVECRKIEEADRDNYLLGKFVLRTTRHGEELPVILFFPKRPLENRPVVLWIDGKGKNSLVDGQGRIRPEIRRLLDAGKAVLSADLLYQGEFLTDGKPLTQARASTNPREYAGYTFGYNHPLFAQRVHDILSLITFVRSEEFGAELVYIVGGNGAGPWVTAASAIAGANVDGIAIDTEGFRFTDLESYRDLNFLPGAVKYGDLPALLALSAPRRFFICGETEASLRLVTAAYEASGKRQNLIIDKEKSLDVFKGIAMLLEHHGGRRMGNLLPMRSRNQSTAWATSCPSYLLTMDRIGVD